MINLLRADMPDGTIGCLVVICVRTEALRRLGLPPDRSGSQSTGPYGA